MEPKPTEWHKRPSNTTGPCPICGFPSGFRGQHRRVHDPDAKHPRFVKRMKSATGWREVVVDTSPELRRSATKSTSKAKAGPAPTDWHRKPPRTVGNCPVCGCPGKNIGEHRRIDGSETDSPGYVLRRSSGKLVSVNLTIDPAQWHRKPHNEPGPCSICGCPGERIGEHRRTSPSDCKYHQFEKRRKSEHGWKFFAIDTIPKKRNSRLPTGPTRLTRERIAAAARLRVFGGKQMPEIAKALGMTLGAIDHLRTTWPAIWKAAEESFTEEIIGIVREQAGTNAILDDVDGHVNRAALADKWTKQRGEDLFPSGERPTLSKFFDDYFELVALDGAEESTKDQYRIALKRWRLITGDPPLEEISTQVLARFRDALNRSRGCKPHLRMSQNTVSSKLRLIQTILDKAGPPQRRNRDAAGWIKSAPWIKRPTYEPRDIRVVTDEEIEAVWTAAIGMDRPRVDNMKPAKWWRSLMCLAYNTGLRRSTIFSLRWKWVDWDNRVIKIPKGAMKPNRNHSAPLNDTLVRQLRSIYSKERRLVLPWSYNMRYFHTSFHQLQELAGIPSDQRFGLHDLRRTLATTLWESNPQAAMLALGHRDPIVTQRHYVASNRIVDAAINTLPQPAVFDMGRSA